MKPSDEQLLQEAKNKVSQCDRCGTCLTVCPLFGIKDIEKSAARGKNAMARALADGGLAPTSAILEAANFCLLCQNCVDSCPNKVKTDEAMVNIRQYILNRSGGATVKYRMLGGIMKRKAVVKLAAASLAMVRALKLNKLVPYGMAPEEYTRSQFAAAFRGPAALGGSSAPSDLVVTPDMKVSYFQGCGMKMMFPAAAAATQAVLSTTTRVAVRDNVCCGIPHLAHGLREDYLEMAKENIALYEDIDVIVTDCGSCGGTLKHIAGHFADDPEWRDRAAAFSAKVMDLTEYLVKVGYQPRRQTDVVVTYHDPCHMVRGQGIKNQPRQLLKAAARFEEMKDAAVCCGGSGTFHMDYPEVSRQLVESKRANIEATGAAVVVSSCPVCLAQLTKAANASGGKFKAMHISQII